jgi:two-component system sensor histidine kinase BaeS
MKLKFRHKVFLTFLLNSLVIVICMLLIARTFAFRNFEDYVSKVEMEKLNELADALGQEYQKSKNWDSVLSDWSHWFRVAAIGPGHAPGVVAGKPPFPPPPLLPVPSLGGNPQKGEPPPFGEPPPPPPGPPPDHQGIAPHLSLFDAERRPLTPTESSSANGYQLKPILVDGQVMGWLGMRRHERPTHPLDVEFLRLQSQTFYSIGGVALLLAVLVTFVLSRHLLAPVKELAEGTRALTSRRFETRIEIRSRDELGQLAADFNTMAQAMQRYEQTHRQWMADISHELRTPLAILRGEIEAMQDGVREISREALESLHFEVLHVGRIVHDLHDLSLIESPTFDAEQTAVNPLEVLEETLRSFHTRFEQSGIRIESAGRDMRPVAIMADSGRLTQLFSNLLENTLRYAHAPGVLRIFQELTPGRLFLHFEDSGPGVPEESLGRLFDRLYRVDQARSRAQGGSGLGLAICRSIVEGVGGRIEASHAPSGGLRITISFPVLSA